jgi:hypothetical protein
VLREIDHGEAQVGEVVQAAKALLERVVPLRNLRNALAGWNWAEGTAGRLALEVLGSPPPPEPPPPPPPAPPVRHPFGLPPEGVEITLINPVTREGVR